MDKYDDLLTSSKRTIKKWELEFEKLESRRPRKEDFKLAPPTVVEAYKLYYKIKRKQVHCSPTSQNLQQICDNSNSEGFEKCPNDNIQKHEEVIEIVKKTPKENSDDKFENSAFAWGSHLNKKKIVKSSNVSESSSPGLSYSKLTEKLMKGAKINIRSSLTNRKKSVAQNKNSNSSEINENSCSDSVEFFPNNENADASLSSNVFDSPNPVLAITSFKDVKNVDDHEEPIGRFKPKIVSSSKPKQSYSFRGLSSLSDSCVTSITHRNVDLQWLDECLAEDKPRSAKCEVKDTDIIYSSDEEVGNCAEEKKKENSILSVPVKRKVEETEGTEEIHGIAATSSKKPRLETQSEVPSQEGVESSFEPESRKETSSMPLKKNSVNAAKQERLEQKMASGTANQNFVRINLKKKVFVRGKKTLTGSSYKRQQWKMRQGGGGGRGGKGGRPNFRSNTFSCKRCGEIGHFAKNCISDKLMSLEMAAEVDGEDSVSFPTLEEAIDLAQENALAKPKSKKSADENGDTEQSNGDFQLVDLNVIKIVEPLFDYESGRKAPDSVYEILKKFGHKSFRPGQESAIMRILSGRSTLVVQSTGAGKSLCYQLPAVMYAQRSSCITIVISPLVSLMEDQVAHLPSFVKAVCLHTNQTETVRQKVVQTLRTGNVHILLISPETVVSSGPYGLTSLLRQLPPVAFVCIDEAHCVSQWSHNFRPSYLRICKVLRQKMNIQTILGLTATAPRSTLNSISANLGIDGEEGVIRGSLLPLNLHLTVSRDPDRDAALLHLLQGDRFKDFNSIIIYCIRREECERVATLLRTYLKDPAKEIAHNSSKRRGISWSSESYHAGLTGARRAAIQKQFMAGKLRIVVATVAFGMGINKSDIRGIIHYNTPRNFESYVQEIGRAGRDGQPAHCHVFMNADGKDLQELRRFIYSNSLDRHVLRKLLRKIVPSKCKCLEGFCVGHEVGVVIESTVNELDLPEENIATLLCHLESHPAKWVLEVGTPVYATCTVRCYGGLQQLKTAARQCPPLGVALAMQKQDSGAQITFPVMEVASAVGWDSGALKRQLKNLEWDSSAVAIGGKVRRSGVLVEFSDLAFHLKMRGDLSESEQDSALEYLHERCINREHTELQQLQRVHQALLSVSYPNSSTCRDEVDVEKSEKLRSFIRDYFEEVEAPISIESSTQCPDESLVRADIRSLILNYRDQTFTARSIARIFHGISSPCFPAEIWGRARKHWRAHLDKDFNMLCKMAVSELLALK